MMRGSAACRRPPIPISSETQRPANGSTFGGVERLDPKPLLGAQCASLELAWLRKRLGVKPRHLSNSFLTSLPLPWPRDGRRFGETFHRECQLCPGAGFEAHRKYPRI